MSKLSGSNYQVQTRRLEFYLAQTARLEAWPLGTPLMVLVKLPAAQGGNAQVFHIHVTKVGLSARLSRAFFPVGAEPFSNHSSLCIVNFFRTITAAQFRLKFRRAGADVKRVQPAIEKKPSAPNALALPGQRFVARQPIFDRAQNVLGYELLFRNGVEDYFNADPELAARSTLDTSLLLGIHTLCDNRLAFVNCTREVLFKDLITLLPPTQAVAEILETVEPEDRVIAACKRLKSFGYRIALDDFAPNDPRIPLCEFADIIKVDIRASSPAQRAAIMRRFGSAKCKMPAEKVETPLEFQQTRDMGFVCFQGYFFCRPNSLSAVKFPPAACIICASSKWFPEESSICGNWRKCSNRKPRFLTACFVI